jgi:hypothetical protein
MLKPLYYWIGVVVACGALARADALFVADEFPAMEVVARQLKAEEGVASKLVDQKHLPDSLAGFQAVVVYIHMGLSAPAERAFIDYAEAGGRLVLLHHSISSGKRQNRDWFTFLGIELPQGDVAAGGYKWTEGVSVTYVNVAQSDPIMNKQVRYPQTVAYAAGKSPETLPAFTLKDTEVYLNHVLRGEHTPLLGLKYTDAQSGQTWMQSTAGWRRPVKQGWVLYFMPGHTAHDFEDAAYGRIVLNAITVPLSR